MLKKIHLIFIPLLLLFVMLFAQGNEPLVLIANKSVPVSNLSKQNLRRIYLGEKQTWDDGSKLIAVNLPANNPLRQKFQSKILGMSTEELQKFWSDEQIKGNIVKPPVNQSSPKAVKLFVSKIPGAIGYVPKSMVDNSVKVIKIDGKSAGSAGYLLN
jgi:ABC-type phosphate transport system substrate-binding protein